MENEYRLPQSSSIVPGSVIRVLTWSRLRNEIFGKRRSSEKTERAARAQLHVAVGVSHIRRPPTNLVAEGEDVSLSFSPEHCILLEA